MSESITPLEAAEKLEWIAKIAETDAYICTQDSVPFLKQTASLLRAIAAGEYKQVVHGWWVHKDCDGAPTENHEAIVYAECSNCGREIRNVDQETATCPSCGALMDGDGS